VESKTRSTGVAGVQELQEYESYGAMECWSGGALEYWSVGVLEYWSTGVLNWLVRTNELLNE
jgi:hypothetical protein